MNNPRYQKDEVVRIVEDGQPTLFGVVVREVSYGTFYTVKLNAYGREAIRYVSTHFMRKAHPLEQLAHQTLGNKTVNLSGKE